MAKSRVTIKDLAEKMNLSASTISRALHNHPGIGKQTTREVRKLAAELGYSRNTVASNLRKNTTTLIGVIVPRIDIHFHSHVISGIEEVAYKSGYQITIYQSRDSMDREMAISKILQTSMVAGVIACIALETDNCDHFVRFNQLDVPLVFYDRVSNAIDAGRVIIDDFEAAFRVTQHLIDAGCKRIAHISGSQNTGIFQSRLEGYRAALLKNGLQSDGNLICTSSDLSYEEGAKCALKLLKINPAPDGLFCANDYSAIGAIKAIKQMHLKVPGDIAVAGFSNYPVSTIIEPSLTTIDDQAFEMGQAAAKLLIRQIENREHYIASETIVIKTHLIVRESTNRTRSQPANH